MDEEKNFYAEIPEKIRELTTRIHTIKYCFDLFIYCNDMEIYDERKVELSYFGCLIKKFINETYEVCDRLDHKIEFGKE